MENSGFPKKARFRRLKKTIRNCKGEVIRREGMPTWICTLPLEDDIYSFGIARLSKSDTYDLLGGKGTAYDRAKDAEALELMEVGDLIGRRGKVRREDMRKVLGLFHGEKFDGEHWSDDFASWEKARYKIED